MTKNRGMMGNMLTLNENLFSGLGDGGCVGRCCSDGQW